MKKMRIIISATVLLFVFCSCNEKSNEPSLILEIEEMPKETFLKFVEKSVDLTDEEKKIIRSDIHPTGYTHVRLAKYQQKGEIFLEIVQFYPRKFIGKDSAGHQLVTGGSGSMIKYRLENKSWSPVEVTHYD